MKSNPYWHAYTIRQGHHRRERGWLLGWIRLLPAVIGLGILAISAEPVWLAFLDGPLKEWSSGIQAAFLRLGMVIVGVQSIRVYGVLIRSEERMVLTLMPVDPKDVGLYQTRRVGWEGLWLIGAAGVLLLPIGLHGQWYLWLLSLIGVAGLWFASLSVSAVVHLFAVGVAESERWAPILDLIRGSNPREQAAFIYAPGVVLLGLGGLVALESWGIVLTWLGQPLGWLILAIPFLLGFWFWFWIPNAALAGWYRATSVLADIDARYGALVESDDALRVYLDWTLRFLPARLAFWARKDMQYGWRARRSWIALTWLVGILGVVAGWTTATDGPMRVLVMVALGAAVSATVVVLMAKDEPRFLEYWLGDGGPAAMLSRLIVVFLWLQVAVWPGVVAVLIRFSVGEALWVLGLCECIVLSFATLGLLSSRASSWGLMTYATLATMSLGGLSIVFFGG